MAQYRPQRNDAGAAAYEKEWAAERLPPDEVAADRAPQLELVSGPEHLRQVRRDLAVVEPFNRESEVLVLRAGCDRVASLRLVAVLGSEPHVYVLACKLTWPVGSFEHDALGACSLLYDLDHACDLPRQSPAYRCSFHGSP